VTAAFTSRQIVSKYDAYVLYDDDDTPAPAPARAPCSQSGPVRSARIIVVVHCLGGGVMMKQAVKRDRQGAIGRQRSGDKLDETARTRRAANVGAAADLIRRSLSKSARFSRFDTSKVRLATSDRQQQATTTGAARGRD
jgi:hypothetical protein